ncbi:MAG: alpha/beta fold hydrolase [Candidatus Eisenbacteria bacterium]
MTRPRALTWRAESPWARFLHLHGLGAHAGWCAPLAERLAAAGVEVVAPNLFNPGRDGTRAADRKDELPSPDEFVSLATDALARFERPDLPLFLGGTSLGGCLAVELAARWARAAPASRFEFAGLRLFAPAFRATYLPIGTIAAMLVRLVLGGGGVYGTPIHRGIEVVHDRKLLARLEQDPDAVPSFSARSHLRAQQLITMAWMRLLPSGGQRSRAARGSLAPILCFQGDDDVVVSSSTNRMLFHGRPGREYAVVRGGRHDLPWEPDTDGMSDRVVAWMKRQVHLD